MFSGGKAISTQKKKKSFWHEVFLRVEDSPKNIFLTLRQLLGRGFLTFFGSITFCQIKKV